MRKRTSIDCGREYVRSRGDADSSQRDGSCERATAARCALSEAGEHASEYDGGSVSGELVAAGRAAGDCIVSVGTDNKIGALIVDDEELARQVLRELLQSHPEVEVLAECANGFEAVKAVTEHKPDLIFFDVQELIEGDIAVIFTTAYDQYAMKAFEVHAVDYLLKPIGGERFESALGR